MSIESRKQLHEDAIGQRWRIAEYLGRGSFGVTYRIVRENGGWEEEGALKVIDVMGGRSTRGMTDAELDAERQAAEKEVQLMYRLRNCPYVVRYTGYSYVNWEENGEKGCDLLIQMDRLQPLRRQMEERVFSEREILSIGRNLCDALIACERENILHRDIKPDNIFDSGTAYMLGDFGISRILENSRGASTAMGTYAYVAPEQIKPRAKYDARADLYSLALTLYELANHNRLPFARTARPTRDEVDSRLAGDPMPAPDGVSAELGAVLLKACAYDPNDRYPDAAAFRSALEYPEAVSQATVKATPSPKPVRETKTAPEYLLAALRARQKGAWDDASRACDDALKTEPNSVDAYVGKVLAELHLVNEEDLVHSDRELEDLPEFRKARELADVDRSVRLGRYGLAVREAITEQKRKQQEEAERRAAEEQKRREQELAAQKKRQEQEKNYRTAVDLMTAAKTETDFRQAAQKFKELNGYRDSAAAAEKCKQNAEACRKDEAYDKGCKSMKSGEYVAALTAFRSIPDHKDVKEKIAVCEEALAAQKKETGTKKKKKGRIGLVAVLILAVVVGGAVLSIPRQKDDIVSQDKPSAEPQVSESREAAPNVSGETQQKDPTYSTDSVLQVEDGVTKIKPYAFAGNSSLTSITIPDNVSEIGASAFKGCTSLSSVTIPNSVTSIGANVFSGCSLLTSVTISDSVTSIGPYVFRDCSSLTSVSIPDSVTGIGAHAFSRCTSLTSITIPDSVTEIGAHAFSRCTSLTSITIPDSVTSIGRCAFEDCSLLAEVTIPDSVTTVEDSAFTGCSSLTSFTIPNSVTTIETHAFHECSALTSVTIPDSVTTIEGYAFWACSSLTDVFYAGTEEQWQQIRKTDGNGDLRNATIHYAE